MMKILVAIKRVVDYNVKVRVKNDQSGVELENVKMSMNPFDEIAVEEALRLKEQGKATEVIVVTVGTAKTQETLRTALAMGADRAIQIECEQELEPLSVAKLLKEIVLQEQAQLIFLGKQSVDGDHNQTGQMLAALLNYPQATFASKVEMINDEARVTREIDGGLETIAVRYPAVITVDLRLNTPRYATLPNIMKAKQKRLDVVPAASLNVNIKKHTQQLKVETPPVRQGGGKVASVAELVDKLKNERGVL